MRSERKTKRCGTLKDDEKELINFIDSHVKKSDINLLADIDSSKVVTSKQLSDMLLNALHGNSFYSYDKGQALRYPGCKHGMSSAKGCG